MSLDDSWEIIAAWKRASNVQVAASGISTSVDVSAGDRQSYVEDCQVCCKPNVLSIGYDTTLGEFFIIG